VRTVLRQGTAPPQPGVATQVAGTLGPDTDWAPLLAGARAVVHLASRAHAPAADGSWIAQEEETARNFVLAARRAGIERIVLMSSVKVLGEVSAAVPFTADMPFAPADAYGTAKARIEAAMRAAALGGPALVVLRPPLVYGPGVKANFLALLRLVDREIPLPLASIANRRSFIGLDNLCDLVALVLTHGAAPGGTFLLRDDEEVSTPALIRLLARHLGRRSRLFPCPPALLLGVARLIGRETAAARLTQSLCVDDGATRRTLGWQPRLSLEDGLAATCAWFRAEKDSPHPASRL
jgi:nucleoside-diphosphate-sugar epimerase